MPYFDSKCRACAWSQVDRWEKVGEFLPCPDCGAATEHVWNAAGQRGKALVDEWPMGKTFDNGFPTPQTFYSKSEYKKALAANGFELRGDGEEHFSWISKEAIEKARELVSRQ